MKRRRIIAHALGWAPGSNRAFGRLELDDGEIHWVPIESPAELAALAAILTQQPVFLFDDGLIGPFEASPIAGDTGRI